MQPLQKCVTINYTFSLNKRGKRKNLSQEMEMMKMNEMKITELKNHVNRNNGPGWTQLYWR